MIFIQELKRSEKLIWLEWCHRNWISVSLQLLQLAACCPCPVSVYNFCKAQDKITVKFRGKEEINENIVLTFWIKENEASSSDKVLKARGEGQTVWGHLILCFTLLGAVMEAVSVSGPRAATRRVRESSLTPGAAPGNREATSGCELHYLEVFDAALLILFQGWSGSSLQKQKHGLIKRADNERESIAQVIVSPAFWIVQLL